MDNNLSRIIYEVLNNIQWGAGIYGSPPYNFEAFTHSQESPYDLAINFLKYYERPAQLDYSRGTQAEYWYQYLGGIVPPKPISLTKSKFKWVLYTRKLQNKRNIYLS